MRKEALEKIWEIVPVDYYQKGIKNNPLQRLWHRGKLRVVSSIIDIEPKNILDVGCASGWFLQQIHLRFPDSKCTGVDPYKDAIVYGKNKYKSLKLMCVDGHKLPFPDKSFDLIISTEVLEHVKSPSRMLKEMRRVLRHNGLIIIEMDTGNILFRTVWFFWTHLRNGVWKNAHIQEFNTKKLEAMIKKSKLNIGEKKYFNFFMAIAFKCKKNEN